LKDCDVIAVQYFYEMLSSVIVGGSSSIAVVPSSEQGKLSTGTATIAKLLVKNQSFDDLVHALERTKTVRPKHKGGDRSTLRDRNSIKVRDGYTAMIKGKTVLLIDDVTTSGNSLNACGQFLIDAGARKVEKIAFAQTC
jgi:predicted amidophosphoribosyltransferase